MPRYSYNREAILACLRGTTTHPSAEWVFEQLKPQIPDLSLGTVYRNLSQFKEQGEIISVGVVNGLERYDARVEPHVHFICNQCEAVLDLNSIAVPEALFTQAAEESGAQVTGCTVNLCGVCQECQKNKKIYGGNLL